MAVLFSFMVQQVFFLNIPGTDNNKMVHLSTQEDTRSHRANSTDNEIPTRYMLLSVQVLRTVLYTTLLIKKIRPNQAETEME
jgi:hypothetical protein